MVRWKCRFEDVRGVAVLSIGLSLTCLLVSCGGGSGTQTGDGSGSHSGGTAAASGEYLWELGSQQNLVYATINTTTGAISSPVKTNAGPANDPADYPSIAVDASGENLYALNTNISELNSFELLGPGLQPFKTSTTGGLNLEQSLSMHPSGKFLYVELSGSMATIEELVLVASSNGVLSAGGKVTEDADLRMTVIDPSGHFLFANDLTRGRIFAYQINQTSGALTPVANSPFTLPAGHLPTYLVIGVSANAHFLYANLSSGGVAAFSIDNSTGALTEVVSSPFLANDSFSSISADPSGRFLYGSNFSSHSVYGALIDPNTGELGAMPGSPLVLPGAAGVLAIDPAGKFLYVESLITTSSGSTNQIYGFSLDSTTGMLTALAGSPFPSVPYPVSFVTTRIP